MTVGAIFLAVALAGLAIFGIVTRRVLVDLGVARQRVRDREPVPYVAPAKPKLLSALMSSLLFGLGPGLVFLFAYLWAPVSYDERIYFATACFMAAALAVTLFRAVSKRTLRPLPWQTGVILIMGGLSLWLRDETFIKMRPTVRFGLGLVLGAWAVANAHPKMQELYEKLDAIGQRRMTALLFICGLASAGANELVWRNSSTLFWIGYQLWGPILIFSLVAISSIPLVRSHYIGTCKVRTSE